jgi:hypothetical protein
MVIASLLCLALLCALQCCQCIHDKTMKRSLAFGVKAFVFFLMAFALVVIK